MQQFLAQLWLVTMEMAPSLLLGLAIAGLLHLVVRKGSIGRTLGRPGAASCLKAALIGVPLPLCSCGVIPAALSLRRDGASRGATTSFLISTPETGVDSVLVTMGMLGWPVALVKVIAAFLAGLTGGVIVDALPEKGPARLEAGPDASCGTVRRGAPARFWDHAFGTIFRDIYGWLAAGLVISALISVFVPPDSLAGASWLRGPAGMLAALAVGMPMYVCSTASVPIAAGLVHAGFPVGAAIVFLMAGPATNIATLGAVRKTLGHSVFMVYLGTIVGFSLLAGAVLDSLRVPSPSAGLLTDSPWFHILSGGAAVLLVAGIAWFALTDLCRFLMDRRMARSKSPVVLSVEGMSCRACEGRVRSLLQEMDGVSAVRVSKEEGTASLLTGQGFDASIAVSALGRIGFRAELR